MTSNDCREGRTAASFSSTRIMTLTAMLALFTYAVVMTVPEAAVNELARAFGQSHTSLGSMFRVFMLSFFVAAVVGGRLSDSLGKLPVVVVGSLAMSAGMLLIARTPAYPMVVLGSGLAGAGGGLVEIVATALICDVFKGSNRTRMMNWSQVLFSAGAFLQPLCFAWILKAGVSWRWGFAGGSALCVVCACAAVVASRVYKPSGACEEQENSRWRDMIRNPLVMLLSGGLFLYVGAEIGLASWVAVFFEKTLGSSGPTAAAAVAVFWVGIGVGRVAATRVSRVLSDYALISWSFALAAVSQAVLLQMRTPVSSLCTTFVVGVFLGPVWPTMISRAGAAFPNRTGSVIGIVAAAGCLGAAVVPPAIGRLSDASGMRVALWLGVLCLLLGLAVLRVCAARDSSGQR